MKNINNPNNIILALDCSLRWTNVSVFADDLCVSRRLDIGRRQAAELPLIVEHVLEETNRALSDIGLIAVTNGPGYFTGIRVGASYAAALAYGLNVKVAPVSTLYMLAYPFILQSQPVLVLVYAGKRRVYAASFGRPSPLDAELPEGEYEGGRLEEWFCENPARKKLLLVSDDPKGRRGPLLTRTASSSPGVAGRRYRGAHSPARSKAG